MKSIKQIFSPGQTSSSSSSFQPEVKTEAKTPKFANSAKSKSKTQMILSGIFLFLLIAGSITASYLTRMDQDTRNQAEVAGENGDCTAFADEGEYYCGSTSPGSCLLCTGTALVRKGQAANNSQVDHCAGLPCATDSIFNTPTCGGDPLGSVACSGMTSCVRCELMRGQDPHQSPQARWYDSPNGQADCAGLVCGTGGGPTPPGACGGDMTTGASCSNLPAGNGCGGYQTCHPPSGYDACDPNPGTNTCTYTKASGGTCVDQCPSVIADAARCLCSNGVTTIGVLPAGGSCEQLCACTGNVCTTCHPTNPPPPPPPETPTPTIPIITITPTVTPTRIPTPTPTLTPTPTMPIITITPTLTPTRVPTLTPTPETPAQCTNIRMLSVNSVELTDADVIALVPGSSAVKFSCSANGNIAKYEFRVILPDGSIETAANNSSLNAVGSITGNYVIPVAGTFIAQCRVCTAISGGGLACQEYETVPNKPVPPTL